MHSIIDIFIMEVQISIPNQLEDRSVCFFDTTAWPSIPGLPHASAEPGSGSSGDRRPGGMVKGRRPAMKVQ